MHLGGHLSHYSLPGPRDYHCHSSLEALILISKSMNGPLLSPLISLSALICSFLETSQPILKLNGAHPQIQRRLALSTKGHFLDETFPINYSKCFSGEDISLINIFPLSIYRIIKSHTYSTFCVIIPFAIFVQMIQALLFLS